MCLLSMDMIVLLNDFWFLSNPCIYCNYCNNKQDMDHISRVGTEISNDPGDNKENCNYIQKVSHNGYKGNSANRGQYYTIQDKSYIIHRFPVNDR
jgi:hypothetical protein